MVIPIQGRRDDMMPSRDLWSEALQALEPDDRTQLLSPSSYLSVSLGDVLSNVQAKRDLALSKRWKYTRSDGTIIILRDVFEKILGWVTKYTHAIDVLANADPIHAGLPWGAFRFLLQVMLLLPRIFTILPRTDTSMIRFRPQISRPLGLLAKA